MKNLHDDNNFEKLMLVAVLETIPDKEMQSICKMIDPYLDAFHSLHNNSEHVGRYNANSLFIGIHLAFWINHDDVLKGSDDPIAMSNLIDRCLAIINLSTEDKMERLLNKEFKLKEEQLKWLLILLKLKAENRSLIYGCLWSLLQIWDYLQRQGAMQQSEAKENT